MKVFTELYKFSAFILNLKSNVFVCFNVETMSSFQPHKLTQPSRWDVDLWFVKWEG